MGVPNIEQMTQRIEKEVVRSFALPFSLTYVLVPLSVKPRVIAIAETKNNDQVLILYDRVMSLS